MDVLREFGTDVLRIKDPDAPVREAVLAAYGGAKVWS